MKLNGILLSSLVLFVQLLTFSKVFAEELINGGHISDSIAVAQEVDTHTFVGVANERIYLSVADISDTNFVPYIRIYTPSGSLIGSQVGKNVAKLNVSLPVSGTFTVTVRDMDYNNNSGNRTGNYNLYFAKSGAAEHGALINGGARSGTIALGDIDTYTFSASSNEQIILSAGVTDGSDLRAWVSVFDSSGSVVTQIYGGTAAKNHFNIPATGTYTVAIQDSTYNRSGEKTGSYDLHFVQSGANEDGELVNGGKRSGFIDVGDIDTFTFTGSAGERIYLSMADTTNSNLSPYIRLYRSNGQFLTSNSGSVTAKIAYSLPANDTYYIALQDSDFNRAGKESGDYAIYFAKSGANQLGALDDGATYNAFIERGEIDSFSFSAFAGEKISLDALKTQSSNLSIAMVVLTENGAVWASDYGDSITKTVTSSGTYTVLIQDSNVNRQGKETGAYSLSYSITNPLLSYVALGDSYSSGEGVFPFRGTYGVDWGYDNIGFDADDLGLGELVLVELPGGCNRSEFAYPAFIKGVDSNTPIEDRTDGRFRFHACTGATTNNIKASGEGLFGEPPQAISTQVNASNDLITISIGGNDAFFSYILMYCMIHDHCHDIKPFDPFTDIELGELITLYIPIVKQKVVDTFSEIKSKAPNAAILALDYPLILSGNECDRAQFSSDTKLSSEEQAWIRGANQMLNQAIREAAAEVGVHSVSVEEHFEGHGVCGDQGEWIFGTWHFWRKGWFHPNSKGQREYAKVINAYLKSISTGWSEGYFQNGLPRNPQPSVSTSTIELGYASLISTLPNLGDLIVRYDETPTSCENIEPRIAPGMTYTLAGAGFAANESVAITLFAGTQTISLGTLSADDTGVIHGSVLVPSDVTVTSFATIEAMAAGANGLGLLLTINLQMIESITIDTDGDGIFDGCDNCPSIANADQVDDDSDSLGNSCDLCPLDPLNDEDNDGICASVDSCPLDANNDQDGDGFCADEDNCSDIFNPDQLDNEFDLLGNLCDNDDDNDGLLDSVETNTGVYLSGSDTGSDPFSADTDGDGVNDAEEIALNRNPNGEGTLPLVNQVPMPFWMMTLFALAICIFGVRTASRKA